MTSRDVLIVLFGGVQSLDVTGPLEVLAVANRWHAAAGREPFYRIRTRARAAAPCAPPAGWRSRLTPT